LEAAAGNSVVYGWVLEPQSRKRLDEVLVSVYHAPHSYTGEESADITCHGGSTAPQAVLEALYAVGFRQALRGEFTFRAFMNGKLDLTRAESVMEMVGARSTGGLSRAAERLSGALTAQVDTVKALVMRSLTRAEVLLDYSEIDGVAEAVGEGGLPEAAAVREAQARLAALAEHYRFERLTQDGALVVLAGKPNAGKSSLFNLLMREERSIVTPVPGTTRDWIEGYLALYGIPLRLVDTAGLREGADVEAVEQLGIERSREMLAQADIVLVVLDGADYQPGDAAPLGLPADAPTLYLWNKADVAPQPARADYVAVSAATGAGIPAVRAALSVAMGRLAGSGASEAAGLGTERQKALVDEALAAVDEALAMGAAGEPLDLTAGVLRGALTALGEITGEVTTSDILDAMFSQFCVGK
jgi:tRNA modification GTPase